MNQMSALKLGAVALVVLPLAGCGGGGSPAVSSPTINASTQSVTPSLGQFDENTHVVIYTDLNKTTSLGDGFISKDGSVTINVGTYKGPYVAVIDGKDPQNAGKGYYDEAQKTWEPLGARQLRALNPDNTQNQNIGVTVLTELAAKYYETHYTPTLTAGNINVANAVIQAAIKNAPPLLTPPALVGANTQANSLDWNGSIQEKYALILAALAQSEASSSKTAANLIDDMGSDSDLATGRINIPANLSQQLQTAALKYANTATQLQMATPAFAVANNVSSSTNNTGLMAIDLPQPSSVAPTTDTDIGLARKLFSDLRSAQLAVSNNSATAPGVYQTVGQKIVTDARTNIRSHGAHLADATVGMMKGAQMLNDLANGRTAQYGAPLSVTDPSTGLPAFRYMDGANKAECYVDVPASGPTPNLKAVCQYNWGNGTYDPTTSVSTAYADQVTISQATTGFAYTASAVQLNYSGPNETSTLIGTPVNGSITQSYDATSYQVTGGTIKGYLPVDTAASPGDTAYLDISALKAGTGGQFTYTLSGSYTYSSGGAPVVTLSANGTKIITQTFGTSPVEAVTSGTIKGVLKTAAYEYDGTFTLQDFEWDKSNTVAGITDIEFEGTVKDNTQPSAPPLFDGKLIVQVKDFGSYDATQPESATNFEHQASSLGGTLNMPGPSPMTLTLGLDRVTYDQIHVSLDYQFGTSHLFGITNLAGLNGSGVAATDQVMVVNSSYGVKITLTRAASTGDITGQVTINTFNPLVATIGRNWIHYRDGSSDTLY